MITARPDAQIDFAVGKGEGEAMAFAIARLVATAANLPTEEGRRAALGKILDEAPYSYVRRMAQAAVIELVIERGLG